MDNRIPRLIKDFVKENPNKNEIDFLSFNDWLSQKDNFSDDWIVVAQRGDITKYYDLFTTSCLISADKTGISKFLSNSNWYIDATFGIPNKYQKPYEGEVYDNGLEAYLDGVKYKPFTFLRHFNKIRPDKFELIQNFLLYYNAYWVSEKSEFHAIDDNGKIIVLVKHEKDYKNEKEKISVDAHSLKDYLAVNNSYLARFHDHRRRSVKDISSFIKGDFVTHILKDESSYFELDLRTDIQYDNIKSTSRLLGKDIVFPYEAPENHKLVLKKDKSEFLEFIVKRDNTGKEIFSTCNPDELSNYFSDKGTPHFLTPIYFQRELLQKYYAEPKKYTVSDGQISYLNIWSIEYDTTKEKLIQVYLGDIGQRLPFSEQLHWKQYNVVPKGKISSHRFKRDFLVQFSSPEIEDSPIRFLKQELETTQSVFLEKFEKKLFKELNENDLHLFDTLHIPITDEWKEFDEQILALAKITTDSFNADLLKEITGKKIGDNNLKGKKIKGLTGLFFEYLLQMKLEEHIIEEIIKPFNIIQAIRSSSVAHRKSKELEKTLRKYDLKELSNEDKIKRIVLKLITSLKLLNKK